MQEISSSFLMFPASDHWNDAGSNYCRKELLQQQANIFDAKAGIIKGDIVNFARYGKLEPIQKALSVVFASIKNTFIS